MFKEKKLRKKIKEICKPDRTFEVFCKENNIDLETQVQPRKTKTVLLFKVFAPIIACALVFCAFIPMMFFQNNSTDGIKKYGEKDVVETIIKIEDILLDKSILLFDYTKAEQIKAIKKTTPIENPELILSYSFNNVIYGFYIEEQLFAFEFDYRIRCYENYDFLEADLFIDLYNTFSYNELDYRYKILELDDERTCYLSFEKDDYEYFIIIKDFEGMTEINDKNIITFIHNLL